MAPRIPLTLACGNYESVRALIEGTVVPEGIDLTILTGMDSASRHWRFLRRREFDAAELSVSSFLMARDQRLPFAAIPVFLHRRFRHGFVFINTTKGIREPRDLIGRKVGIWAYSVSAILWMRGILEQHYGVPHKSIEWIAEIDENLDFTPPPDLRLTMLTESQSVETMLAEGEIDALLHPDLIKPLVARDPRVGRLWPDFKTEELRFFRETGIFPIMHVMGIRQEIVDEHPWIPANLYRAFDKSKAIAMARMEDPDLVPLAWYGQSWDEERALLGPDPWQYGLTDANRKNLATVIGYSHAHGLIRRPTTPDALFLPVDEAEASAPSPDR